MKRFRVIDQNSKKNRQSYPPHLTRRVFRGGRRTLAAKARIAVSLLTIAAVIVSIVPSGFVHAAPATAASMSPEDLAKSYSYTQSLATCIQHHIPQDINVDVSQGKGATADQIMSGTSPFYPNQGYVYPGDTNQSCTTMLSGATALWGISNADFLGWLEYTYSAGNGQPQWSGSGDGSTRLANFNKSLSNNIYGGQAPYLTDAAKYAQNWAAFTKSCSPKDLGTLPLSNSTQNTYVNQGTIANGTKYTKLTVATSNGKPQVHGYSYTTYTHDNSKGNQTTQVALYGGGSDPIANGVTTRTCDDIAKGISANALAYASSGASGSVVTGDPGGADCNTNGSCGDKPTCVIDGIGWILCPVVTFMSKLVDGSYAILQSTLLRIPPVNTSTDAKSNGLYSAWSIMRNFANIAFVITFLVIIYSQLTGFGVTNYGIKKLLPKLVIAAILVNVSYWLCAIAVDISNILGNSLKDLMDSIAGQVNAPNGGVFSSGWGGIAGSILGGTITVGVLGVTAWVFGITIFLPLLICVLTAVVTVIVVLTVRQVLVILLIVISPLAFVALLLPNTERWFKRWRELLMTMLLMYPIIALIFGASELASKIIMASSNSFLVQVTGAAAAIIPLAITPIIMKTAGGLLGKIGGFVNNPNKGPIDRMRKGAKNMREREVNRMNNAAINGKGRFGVGRIRQAHLRRQARIEGIDESQKRELNRAKTEFLANEAEENNQSVYQRVAGAVTRGKLGGKGYRDQMAEGGGDAADAAALANAISVKAKLEAEEVTAAQAIVKDLNLNQEQARVLAMGEALKDSSGKVLADSTNNLALRAAARQQVINTGDYAGMASMIDASQNWGEKDRIALADALQASSTRPAYASMGNLAALRQGNGKTSRAMMEEAIKNNTYSAERIASADKDEIAQISEVAATSANISAQDKAGIAANAQKAIDDPILGKKINKSMKDVVNLRDGNYRTLPPVQTQTQMQAQPQNTSTTLAVPHNNQPPAQQRPAAPPPPSSVDVDIATNQQIVNAASSPPPRAPTQAEADNAANLRIVRDSAAAEPPRPTRPPTQAEIDNATNYRIARDNTPPTPPENGNGS